MALNKQFILYIYIDNQMRNIQSLVVKVKS
jgi:hypothetical protein